MLTDLYVTIQILDNYVSDVVRTVGCVRQQLQVVVSDRSNTAMRVSSTWVTHYTRPAQLINSCCFSQLQGEEISQEGALPCALEPAVAVLSYQTKTVIRNFLLLSFIIMMTWSIWYEWEWGYFIMNLKQFKNKISKFFKKISGDESFLLWNMEHLLDNLHKNKQILPLDMRKAIYNSPSSLPGCLIVKLSSGGILMRRGWHRVIQPAGAGHQHSVHRLHWSGRDWEY